MAHVIRRATPYLLEKAAGPYTTCPVCGGSGGDHLVRCHECLGVGFIPEEQYEQALAHKKQKPDLHDAA